MRRMMIGDMSSDVPSRHKPIAISVEDHFDRMPFTLSAAAIQKINDIVVSRLPGELVFDIGYGDGTQLSALDLERVLNDDNPGRRSIKKLECSFGSAPDWVPGADRVVLTFDPDSFWPISLNVSSLDRDRVWLTVVELRDYISSEVARRSRLPKWVKLTGIASATVAGCWALLRWGRTFVSPPIQLPNLTEVIQSADPNAKLNYLLLQQSASAAGGLPKAIALAVIAAGILGLMVFVNVLMDGDVLPSLFPRSHFTIGKGAERYDRQKGLQSRLFWGVFVAFVVGVLRSVFLSLFTKP